VNRGDIVFCDFGDPVGHEPAFRRPALVISAEAMNRHGTPVVLPITRIRRGYPTHVEMEGLPVTSYIQCELVRAISDERIIRTLGRANASVMSQVAAILRRIMAL